MCGITGIKAFNEIGRFFMINNAKATAALAHRGPDSQGFFLDDLNLLSHRRLSILDTSSSGNQPMRLENDRFVIAYNGEIYNFKEIRKSLQNKGISFKSNTDTEVVLKLLSNEGINALDKLNGFFALALYDKAKNEITIARDRVGIKPMYYYIDSDKFAFGSEIRSILKYNVEKTLDQESLAQYFQYNFVPEPQTIFKDIKALTPGQFMTVGADKSVTIQNYATEEKTDTSLDLRETLEQAIERRLIADVDLGCFLSGGIDSTIITGVAAQVQPGIHTFSVGYRDNTFFDESKFAALASKQFNTNHHSFMLSEYDLLNHVEDLFNNLDQPFADSSALPTYILAKETRKHVKVALSGDGADELFAGYNKHKGEYLALHPGLRGHTVTALSSLWNNLPQSRNNPFSNTVRQLARYANGRKLSFEARYQQWCKINTESNVKSLLSNNIILNHHRLKKLEEAQIDLLKTNDLQSVLLNDQKRLLVNDMLTKVDRMSMANSLEVRVPFLDKNVIAVANKISIEDKISNKGQKMVLKEVFKDLLPKELLDRPKHGFDVPLLKWLKTDLKTQINDLLLDKDFIKSQGIFNHEHLQYLVRTLHSTNPKDSHAQIWGVLVFQKWHQQNFNSA